MAVTPSKRALSQDGGYTLLELMIAMGLTIALFGTACGVYLHFHKAFFSRDSTHQIRMEVRTIEKMLEKLIIEGKGVVYLSKERLILLNIQKNMVDFKYDQDKLFINGKPSRLKVRSFSVEAWGPHINYPENGLITQQSLPVNAELDEDLNGIVDMEELDRDLSNDLGPDECHLVGLIRISAEIEGRAEILRWMIQAHPRSTTPPPPPRLLNKYLPCTEIHLW